MPRPPLELVALSEISSIPQASSAATSFMSESTLPRITPSLASIRWIVGSDRSDIFASLRWSMWSIARVHEVVMQLSCFVHQLLRRNNQHLDL
jgi:hypothetical protein